MAGTLSVIETFQKNYDKTVLKALAETDGGTLPEMVSRITTADNMEDAIFYEIDASTTSSTLDFTDPNDGDTAGDIKQYSAVIEPIYAKRRVYMNELNKTSLNLDSDFIESFVRAIDRKINTIFLGAIDVAKAGNEIGDATKTSSTQLNVFIRACKLAAIRSTSSKDRGSAPLLIMSSVDYADLFDKASVTSKDFEKYNAGGMFYGLN